MRLEDDIDFTTLNWVKPELDQALARARQALETYVEAPEDAGPMQVCAAELHQVQGTLRMVELYGAAMVVQEMEHLVNALLEGQVEQRDDAYGALMRGVMQMPDYLERLQSGYRDIPIVLLPLLNDLRTCRGVEALHESELFRPNLELPLPPQAPGLPQPLAPEDQRHEVMTLRLRFQRALLAWFRGGEAAAGTLATMRDTLDLLTAQCHTLAGRRLWWIAAGVIDGLGQGSLDANGIEVKQLIGRVDRCINDLLEKGEGALADGEAIDLEHKLLYCVARAQVGSLRLQEVRDTYRLEELLPDAIEVEHARSSLAGHNRELLDTVAQAIKDDLLGVKDALDMFLHQQDRDPAQLAEQSGVLDRVGDTLGMLGLNVPRRVIGEQCRIVQDIAAQVRPADEESLLDVAGALLYVEASLDDHIDRLGAQAPDAEQEPEPAVLPRSEARQVVAALMREAVGDIDKVKDMLVAFVESPWDHAHVAGIPALLKEVCGALRMVDATRPVELVQGISRFVHNELIVDGRIPTSEQMDRLADALASVEYYLEAARERRGGLGHILDVTEQSLVGLGYWPVPAARGVMPEAGAPMAAVEPFPGASTVPENIELTESVTIARGKDVGDMVAGGSDAAPVATPQDIVGLDLAETAATAPLAADDGDWIEVEEGVEEQVPVADAMAANAGFQDTGEELDAEIRDVFLEEVAEQIEAVHTQLGVWQQAPEDMERLLPIRRAFHTLKGSGRLVGAQSLGEFSWKIENMLNRVLDGTIEPNANVQALTARAADALSGLLAALKDEGTPRDPLVAIAATADRLAAGDATAMLDDAAPAATQTVKRIVKRRVRREAPSVVVPEPPTASFTTTAALPDMDPMLVDILRSEVAQHLATIRAGIDAAQGGAVAIGEPMLRAVHTLHGAIATVDIPVLSDLLLPLEGWLKRLRALDRSVPAGDADVLAQSADLIEQVASKLDDAHAALPDAAVLTTRVQQLRDELPEPFMAHPLYGEVAPPVVAAVDDVPEAVPSDGVTPYALTGAAATPAAPAEEPQAEASATDLPAQTAAADLEAAESAPARDDLEAAAAGAEAAAEAAPEVAAADADVAVTPADPGLHEEAAVEPVPEPESEPEPAAQADGEPAVAGEAEPVVEAEPVAEVEPPAAATPEPEPEPEPEPAARAEPESVSEPVAESRAAAEAAAEAEAQRAAQELLGSLSPDFVFPSDAQPDGPLELPDIDSELLDIFVDESNDLLDQADGSMTGLREQPRSHAPLAGLQRDLHTLKGGARMATLVPIGDLAHAMESLLDALSRDQRVVDADVVESLERGFDYLHELVQRVAQRYALARPDAVIAHFEGLVHAPAADGEADAEAVEQAAQAEAAPAAPVTPRVRPGLLPEPDQTQRAAQEMIRVRADLIDSLVNYAGEVSIYRARLEQQVGGFRFNLVEFEQTVARLRDQLRKLEIETEAQIIARYQREHQDEGSFDPLELDRFSQLQQYSRALAESVADLVSLQTMLDDNARQSETLLLQQSRVSSELQEGLMRTRMVPFDSLVPTLRRTLRQACQETGKHAQLRVTGAHGEMDRNLLERMKAPFEHMLRNALAHGIETPRQRRRAGKPDEGTVTIDVARDATEVVIRVSDDGAGMDRDAIRSRAIARGLMHKGAKLSDSDLFGFVLETGFSTASKVTQLAGRGVGMDVVANEVKQIGGTLSIASQRGQGTTFTLRLPFTLAVTQAVLVKVGDATFAVPMTSVQGVARVKPGEDRERLAAVGRNIVYGGEEYIIHDLANLLGVPAGHLPDDVQQPLLLARGGDLRAAVRIDAIIGSREIVVKSVGPQISSVPGIFGATIMGDGSVLLILDLVPLVRHGLARIVVPAEAPVEGEPEAEAPTPVVQPAVAQHPTVMVVDDSITMRKVTGRILERHAYEVVTAKDGLDAVEKLQERVPDLMLLDIEMPRMDGYELATHMKNDPRLKDVPIIMITSRSGEKHRQRALDIGVDHYIGKPYQEAELIAQITQLLGNGDE